MAQLGHVQNGVIVPDHPAALPEGATVRIEIVSDPKSQPPKRIGGVWRGQIQIADDFDELPPDLAEEFGMKSP